MKEASKDRFEYRATIGWLRDLASQPTPTDTWPCIRWDDQLLKDQIRFLDVMAEMGVEYNVTWGYFINRSWPVSMDNVIDSARKEKLRAFVDAAHQRKIKMLSGVGIYSWGFDEIISKFPEVTNGHVHAMCLQRPAAWDWQRRVLDFLMRDEWGLDGISMQSADQGRCECEQCRKLSTAAYHAEILTRSAEYVRRNRPQWVVGTACWGLPIHDEAESPHVQRVSRSLDYMVEVHEKSAELGRRTQIIEGVDCAFGSLGGVFIEPPQHWDRERWFVPCGLSSAQSLAKLWSDGGRACEYYYRPFANPTEEVSWRTGARVLSSPATSPEEALKEALAAVFGASGAALESLAELYTRAENAYFSRSTAGTRNGPVSLEPLWWEPNPATPGPAVYLQDQMTPAARADYAAELIAIRAAMAALRVANQPAIDKTLTCIDGTLADIAKLAT